MHYRIYGYSSYTKDRGCHEGQLRRTALVDVTSGLASHKLGLEECQGRKPTVHASPIHNALDQLLLYEYVLRSQ